MKVVFTYGLKKSVFRIHYLKDPLYTSIRKGSGYLGSLRLWKLIESALKLYTSLYFIASDIIHFHRLLLICIFLLPNSYINSPNLKLTNFMKIITNRGSVFTSKSSRSTNLDNRTEIFRASNEWLLLTENYRNLWLMSIGVCHVMPTDRQWRELVI